VRCNIELQWLLCASYPTTIVYPTLARDPLIKNLFKLFVSFLKDAELIGCEIIAIDGTKAERTQQ
jgi:hypothetical protein